MTSFLGLLAAFGSINHGIILDWIQGRGIGGTILCCFSFFPGWFQSVSEAHDPCFVVFHEVWYPSPLPFNTYIKLTGEIIHHYGGSVFGTLVIFSLTPLSIIN